MNDRSISTLSPHSRLRAVAELGQQLWLDLSGVGLPDSAGAVEALGALVADGIEGVYLDGSPVHSITDVQQACDQLARLHRASLGQAGLVSLPVDSGKAHDSAALLESARSQWQHIDRANAMLAMPATAAGIAALEQATFEGMNIAMTLVYSPGQVRAVRAAHRRGLARRLEASLPVHGIASAVALEVGALDAAVDAQLARSSAASADSVALRGRAALSVARLAWQEARNDSSFAVFSAFGAAPQRLLWRGTDSTAPAPRDVRYVEALIGHGSSCAITPATLEAFRDHGVALPALETGDIQAARAALTQLAHLGIELESLGVSLQQAALLPNRQTLAAAA
ncbi:MAG: transaldolase [Paucibacter sp.]|nr:transaldolase [Roseateles sp.]